MSDSPDEIRDQDADKADPAERLVRLFGLVIDYVDLLERKLLKRLECLEDELDYLKQCEHDRREKELGLEFERMEFQRDLEAMERRNGELEP